MSRQAEALNAMFKLLEPALTPPPKSPARLIEGDIVAAKLEAHEAADMLDSIVASLEVRYGEDAKQLTEIRLYVDLISAAIMELDK